MSMNKNKIDEYGIAVCDAILSLFRDEENDGNPNFHYDLDKIDATEFFTGVVLGCNLLYNQLTNDNKNILEFSYLVNHLAVQHLIDNIREECKKNKPDYNTL